MAPCSFKRNSGLDIAYIVSQASKTNAMTNDQDFDISDNKETPQYFLKSDRHNRQHIVALAAQPAKKTAMQYDDNPDSNNRNFSSNYESLSDIGGVKDIPKYLRRCNCSSR